ILAPSVLVVDRATQLSLGLPGRRDASPVLGGSEDVLGLRERDEGQVEPARLAVEGREVQERPAAALEGGAVVLPMEALKRVEEEGLAPLAVVLVRREHARGEEGLGDDGGILASFRLVQGFVERRARIGPPP